MKGGMHAAPLRAPPARSLENAFDIARKKLEERHLAATLVSLDRHRPAREQRRDD
jgi:hypothetical protein